MFPENMNMKPTVKDFRHEKKTNKNKKQNIKTKSYMQQNAMPVSQVTILSRTAKKHNTFASYWEEETLNETEIKQIMEELGEVKKSE